MLPLTIGKTIVNGNSQRQNCYSYAFNLPQAANPGDYSANSQSERMYNNKKTYTAKEAAPYVLRDMNKLGKPCRIVNDPSEKKSTEYIVAFKTANTLNPKVNEMIGDYHFARQLSNGKWADKPGVSYSRYDQIDGMAKTWDYGDGDWLVKDYYNTETVFFAVEG